MGAALLLPAKRKPPSYLTATRLSSHAAGITCILLSGDRAFTASKDRSVNMWLLSHAHAAGRGAAPGSALALDKAAKVFEGHSHWVTELLLEKSGCLLYSASMDKTVRVWDVANAVCLYVYCGHSDWVSGLGLVFSEADAFHAAAAAASPFTLIDAASTAAPVHIPAPDYVMSCSHDGTLRLWQPYRPSLRSRADQACLAAFTLPGGGSITSVSACSVGVVCASNFGSVAFLSTSACEAGDMRLQSVRAHNGPITVLSAVHWLPSSSLPSAPTSTAYYAAASASQSSPKSPSTPAAEGDVPVCFSGGADGSVRMWALQPLRCLHKYEGGTSTGVQCVAFHPGFRLLSVAYEKGETLGWMEQKRVPLHIQLLGSVKGIAHARHGGVIAATTSGVAVYHPTKGHRLVQLSDRRCSCLVYKEEAGSARVAFAEDSLVVICAGDVLHDAPHDVAVKMGR